MTTPKRGKKKAQRFPTKPQDERKHPNEWERDLNPHSREGQNIGRYAVDEDPRARAAADIKELTEILTDFRADELAEIPVVSAGKQLKQGAVYLDLRNPAVGPFVATGGIVTEEHNHYVPKAEVPYEYWNRLVQSLCPERVRAEENPSEEQTPGSGTAAPDESLMDKTIADSFPASDPPAWTMGRERKPAAPPGERPRKDEE